MNCLRIVCDEWIKVLGFWLAMRYNKNNFGKPNGCRIVGCGKEQAMSVPKNMQEKYDELAAMLEPYCEEYLNSEYKELCLHALEKLCRKRPSPLTTGRARTWAAGIVYAVGQNNWIFDKSQPIHMTADELVGPFGVAKTTASSKAAEIRKMLKIDHFNVEWILASDVEKNAMLWYVLMDGLPVDARTLPIEAQIYCAERGLIPYVPAFKDKGETMR